MLKTIHIYDKKYPVLFKEIDDPPKRLYCDGDLMLLDSRCIAVVGSRKCTPYGANVARKLGRRAAECGVTLVSGMAGGIDSAALWGAIDAGGSVIAVLGTGLDICYPRDNQRLMEQIRRSGLLLTEFEEGDGPKRWHFPVRNRLISGLSEVVVVVEAAFSSGALKTAEYAVDQNRILFAVPGSVFSAESMGTNKLIQDGAQIMTVINDPFDSMNLCGSGLPPVTVSLGKDEKAVYDLINQAGELMPEQLCRMTGMSPSRISALISLMEMKGVLVTYMGRIFIDKSGI